MDRVETDIDINKSDISAMKSRLARNESYYDYRIDTIGRSVGRAEDRANRD